MGESITVIEVETSESISLWIALLMYNLTSLSKNSKAELELRKKYCFVKKKFDNFQF